MDPSSLIIPERIRCRATLHSRTRALQAIAALLAAHPPDELPALDEHVVFDSLAEREQLGSTALGHGVALPHARMDGVERPFAALLTLASGADFDAPDDMPVDIVFGLLVPAEAHDEHLEILAASARRFADASLRDRLRGYSDRETRELWSDLREHAPAA